MATTETTTPPERCPVCGWVEDYRNSDEGRVTDIYYNCGAHWVRYSHGKSDWVDHCPHAMTAALRCGATLEPTPLETARAEMEDAAAKWADAVYGVAYSDSAGLENAHYERSRAADMLLLRIRAYRALLEPKP